MRLNETMYLGEPLNINMGGRSFKTKLLDFEGDQSLLVYHPTFKKLPVALREGETVRFSFFRPDGIYGFFAVFEGRVVKDSVQGARFLAISEIERNQRRAAYRLPVHLNALIRGRQPEAGGEEQEADKVTTINLSEYGMLFRSAKPYEVGEQVCVQLNLERHYLLQINAEVVRCEMPEKKGDSYRVAVHFADVSDSVYKYLARYIIQQQIILRQKEDE